MCTPPVLFQVQPEKKKSLLAQTSPALQPLLLAFCQLLKVSGVIIWPKLPKTTAGANTFSQCVSVLVLSLGRHAGEKKKNTDGTAPAFGKCLAFLGFKELADGRVHRLLGTSMKANIFLREDVLPMHTTVLLGTRKFYQSA